MMAEDGARLRRTAVVALLVAVVAGSITAAQGGARAADISSGSDARQAGLVVEARGITMATGVAVDSNGQVFVSDYVGDAVRVYRDGEEVSRIGGRLAYPHGLVFDGNGTLLVANFGDRSPDTEDGFISKVSAGSTTSVEWTPGFAGASGVSVTADGNVLVADGDGRRVYSVDGSGVATALPGNWVAPHAAIQLANGDVVVTEYSANRVSVLRDGNVSPAHSVYTPVGLTPDGRGGYFVSSQSGGSVLWVHADGDTEIILSGVSSPTGLAVAGGRLYVSTFDSSRSVVSVPIESPTPAPPAPGRPTAMPTGTSVVVSWSAVSGSDSYRVAVSPSDLSCATAVTACTIRGLTRGTRYGVQVFSVAGGMESEGSPVATFVAGDPPGAVSGVKVVPGNGSAVVSWLAPATDGGSPITGYRVVSAPGGLTCEAGASESSCQVNGLTNGVPYLFTVSAVSAVGEGPGTVSEEAVAFSWPGVPPNVRPGVRSMSSAEVRWDAADPNGSTITGYVLRVSRDNGVTWADTSLDVATKANVPGLTGPAQAAWVQISAVSAQGQGAFSDPVLVTTTGVAPSVRVAVVDSEGVPVIGGAITWAMSNGAASSSKTYGLTEAGVIEFPLAPAGEVDVEVTGALTAAGASVSGTFNGFLGFTSTVLRLPAVPVATRTVTVRLPNGLAVPGVTVSLDPDEGQYQDSDCLEWALGDLGPEDYCLEGQYGPPSLPGGFSLSKTVEGFTFSVPRVAQTETDAYGQVQLTGFSSGQPRVDVFYDDGIIRQTKSVVLRGTSTEVGLDYMPWVEVPADSVVAESGDSVTIPVTIATETARGTASDRSARAKAGVKVTILPPPGAPKGTCKSKLTARTNAQGRASLTVCATKSGVYRFKAQGAAAIDGLLLRVKGVAPLPPTAVAVSSLRVGTARVTWNAPRYNGGAKITGYVITATAPGKPTVTKSVSGSLRSLTLTGLANARTYTVRIQAKTARGLSDPVTTTVPVA